MGGNDETLFEDGALRRCRDHECDTDAAPPPEGGDTKRVEFTNRCTEGVRFALLHAHGRPPEGTKIHALSVGERGVITMDANARVVVLDDAGGPLYSLTTDGDGEVRFFDDDQSDRCTAKATAAGQ